MKRVIVLMKMTYQTGLSVHRSTLGEFEMFNDGKYIWKNNITGASRITREVLESG